VIEKKTLVRNIGIHTSMADTLRSAIKGHDGLIQRQMKKIKRLSEKMKRLQKRRGSYSSQKLIHLQKERILAAEFTLAAFKDRKQSRIFSLKREENLLKKLKKELKVLQMDENAK